MASADNEPQSSADNEPQPSADNEPQSFADNEPQSYTESHIAAMAEDASTPAIDELQSALGPVLLAHKEKLTPFSVPSSYERSANWARAGRLLPALRPKWNGAFELFAFPRELRDKIYFHYLYRPNGIVYKRSKNLGWPFEQDGDVVSLFLISRQVYHEALQIFSRYTQVNFGDYVRYYPSSSIRGFEGKLRMFPAKHASTLQRVNRGYSSQVPAVMWNQMVRDAHTFKRYCPKLHEFTAYWSISFSWYNPETDIYEDTKVLFDNMSEEERVQAWLDLMRRWAKETNLVPPAWVKLRVWNTCDWWPRHEQSLSEAYMRHVREIGERDVEHDMEEAEKKWLEESRSDVMKREGRRR